MAAHSLRSGGRILTSDLPVMSLTDAVAPWLLVASSGVEGDGRLSVTDVVVAGLGEPALVCEHDRLGTVAETKLA